MNATVFPPVPVDTAKAARAVFGRSNLYLTIGDQANELFSGIHLEDFPGWDQKPARTLAMLYLITVFQYMETLPDLTAADALRERVDWKYALHLPINHPGLEAASFCEFRKWLLLNRASEKNLQMLLERLSEIIELNCRQRFPQESGQVIASVCLCSRLANVSDAVSRTLEVLAVTRPDWLLANSLPHWYSRYGKQRRSECLETKPLEQERSALVIGSDGFYLLRAIQDSGGPELASLPEVQALKQIWQEQFERVGEKLVWREEGCSNCSLSNGQKIRLTW